MRASPHGLVAEVKKSTIARRMRFSRSTGLGSAQKLTKVKFAPVFVGDLALKAQYMESYGSNYDNVEMSTL